MSASSSWHWVQLVHVQSDVIWHVLYKCWCWHWCQPVIRLLEPIAELNVYNINEVIIQKQVLIFSITEWTSWRKSVCVSLVISKTVHRKSKSLSEGKRKKKKNGSGFARGIWLVSGHAASETGSSNRPPPTLHRVAWCHRALSSRARGVYTGRTQRRPTGESDGQGNTFLYQIPWHWISKPLPSIFTPNARKWEVALRIQWGYECLLFASHDEHTHTHTHTHTCTHTCSHTHTDTETWWGKKK